MKLALISSFSLLTEMARLRLQLRDHYGWFPRLAALLRSGVRAFSAKRAHWEEGN
jgi:hypothetical protein